MIFVTLGTHEAAFPRLIRALESLPRHERLIVQHGCSEPGPDWAESVDFLPFEALAEHVRSARVLIMHAGVGSIMVALSHGKRPVVVPRLRRLGEHVDDHQVALARRLGHAGLVTAVDDVQRLPAVVAADRDGGAAALAPPRRLVHDLREYLAELAAPAVAP